MINVGENVSLIETSSYAFDSLLTMIYSVLGSLFPFVVIIPLIYAIKILFSFILMFVEIGEDNSQKTNEFDEVFNDTKKIQSYTKEILEIKNKWNNKHDRTMYDYKNKN